MYSERPHPGGRDPGRSAQRQHFLFWFVPLWRGVEPARSGGIPGVQGVWTHEAGGSRFMLVISSRRSTAGIPSRPPWWRRIAHAGAYNNRWTIVVDDDIGSDHFSDVVWAMCTRCDPRDSGRYHPRRMELALDPMCYDAETDRRNSRVMHRRLHSVPAQEDLPRHRPFEQGARRPHPSKVAKDLPKGF